MKKKIMMAAAFILTAVIAVYGTLTFIKLKDNGKEASVSEVTSYESSGSRDISTASEAGTAIETSKTVSVSGRIFDESDLFTERDLEQTYDADEAEILTLESGTDVTVSKGGVYIIRGSVSDVTVTVDAGDEDKVQLVLDGTEITNTDFPCIYVKNADKVFVTTTDKVSTLSVTGEFTADGDTNTDAVIFSKDDLVIGGTGTLKISSTDNGISGKDDVKVTGGTIIIDSVSDAIEANDSIAVADGDIRVTSKKDGLHAENEDDDSKGYIVITGGKLNITAADDAIQGTSVVQINDGTFDLNAGECIEGTYIQINGGTIAIEASDDGINASAKSSAYTPTVEINGGDITLKMGSGDTDGIDSNGDLYINGGTIDITAQSPFDYDGTGELNGGTVTVNGSRITSLTNQMMGGRMQGDFGNGGGIGGFGNGNRPDEGSVNGSRPDDASGQRPGDGSGRPGNPGRKKQG